jgi:hypothetical protein
LGWWNSHIWNGKIKFMFQNTNQLLSSKLTVN